MATRKRKTKKKSVVDSAARNAASITEQKRASSGYKGK